MAFLSIRNFTQRTRSEDLSSVLPAVPRIDLAFVYARSFRPAGKGSPASHFFTSPDLIVLHRIYAIALYVNYLIQLHHFYLNCVERGLGAARLEVRPRTPLHKLISLFLRQVDLASASEALCRGLCLGRQVRRKHPDLH